MRDPKLFHLNIGFVGVALKLNFYQTEMKFHRTCRQEQHIHLSSLIGRRLRCMLINLLLQSLISFSLPHFRCLLCCGRIFAVACAPCDDALKFAGQESLHRSLKDCVAVALITLKFWIDLETMQSLSVPCGMYKEKARHFAHPSR